MLWHNKFFNEVRENPEAHPRLVKERMTISEKPAHTKYKYPVYDHDLNARERKHTFDHSTMFYPEGPDPESVYKRHVQKKYYEKVSPTFTKNAKFVPAKIQTLTPSEMLHTHNEGHRLVDRVGTADGLRVYGSHKNETIPKEIWNTSTNVKWNDPRVEVGRAKSVQKHGPVSAKDLKTHEMSSELFGTSRGAPDHPLLNEAPLIPATTRTFGTDSLISSKKKPNPVSQQVSPKASKISQLSGKNAARTLCRTLDPMGLESYDPIAYESTTMVPMGELVPVNPNLPPKPVPAADRRRTEKNYSDLFGVQLATPMSRQEAKRQVKSQEDQDWLRSSIKTARNMNSVNQNATPKWHGLGMRSNSTVTEDLEPVQKARGLGTASGQVLGGRLRDEEKAVWGIRETFSPTVELNRQLQTGVYATRKTPKQRKQDEMRSSIFDHEDYGTKSSIRENGMRLGTTGLGITDLVKV